MTIVYQQVEGSHYQQFAGESRILDLAREVTVRTEQ